MTEQSESRAAVYRDILGSVWPAFSMLVAVAGGGYFLVIEPLQRKGGELETRLEKLEARLAAVEKEQWIRTGTVARFNEHKAAAEREILEIRATIAILSEKIAEMRANARRQ